MNAYNLLLNFVMDGSIARLSMKFAFKKLDFDITDHPGWLEVIADAFLMLANRDHI